jgi:hypothetical protein
MWATLSLRCDQRGLLFSPSPTTRGSSRYPTQGPKAGLTSCLLRRATAACAAFIEESRMKFINAKEFRQKSGASGASDALRMEKS